MRYIIIIIFLVISIKGLSTGQKGELIIYQGDTLEMLNEPLFEYLDTVEVNGELSYYLKYGCSTALWRGYQGLWKIKNDSLFLIDIYGCARTDKSFIKDIFQNDNEPIFSNWYSGELYIQKGKLIKYNHTGYDRVYENESVIKILNGIVAKTNDYKNGVKPSDTGLSRNPTVIMNEIYKRIDWDRIPKLSKDYKISFSFQIDGRGELVNTVYSSELDSTYTSEIETAVNSLPKIQVLYSRGEPAFEGWHFYLTLNRRNKRKFSF